jgi:hypothetical protein
MDFKNLLSLATYFRLRFLQFLKKVKKTLHPIA